MGTENMHGTPTRGATHAPTPVKFAQRTNVTVAVEISPDFGRLSREKEIAVFRVVQESLANVQEHSGSATASVRITKSSGHVCVQVSDLGKGMSPRSSLTVAGVGSNGMREGLPQLGGLLNIHSTSRGTLVTADLPVD
jgi:two-component system NarL family sensor kinase